MIGIQLTKGYYAIIDECDEEHIVQYKWSAKVHHAGLVYPVRGIMVSSKPNKTKIIKMHNQIMKPPKGFVVDHIDGNSLNNQRANLRLCRVGENTHNTKVHCDSKSKMKGVIFDSARGKFRAEICVNYKRIYLGRFLTAEEANKAYKTAAKKHYGEFDYYNRPEST